MNVLTVFAVTLILMLLSAPVYAGAATRPARESDNGWDAGLFSYERSGKLVVEETTPTAAQVDFFHRPPQMKEPNEALKATTGPAKPRTIDGVDLRRLRFRDANGEIVTALLCTPTGKTGPFPVAIAAHGLGSNKAQVCGQVAPAMIKQRFAVLAPDLPLHGERPGDPHTIWSLNDPLRAFQLYHQAVLDVRQCIDIAQSRADLDTSRGVTLIGYSMGSWINSVAGAADDRVTAMVLMVGGAKEVNQNFLWIPQYAAIQPQLAIAHFAGRPLLMMNAKADWIVTPEMSRRLYVAAQDPKEQIWYDGGHLLPKEAYETAAKWVKTHTGQSDQKRHPLKAG